VTLVGEADRKMLKAAIKHASGEDQVRHRHVPPEAVSKWSQKLNDLKDEIAGILQEEKEEKQVSQVVLIPLGIGGVDSLLQLRTAEMELKKGQNLIEHEEEIHSRPARTWFQSEKEKQKARGRRIDWPAIVTDT
jgi:ATP-dependent RNA helicase DDX27